MKLFPKRNAVLFIFAVFAGSLLWAESPSQKVSDAFIKAGLRPERDLKALPDFPAISLANVPAAGRAKLADYKGKIVFVNLWATWCGPCRAEMPSMEKLYQRYKSRGFEILAVNLQEQKNQVESFMKQYNLSFPALLDSDGAVSNAYGVRAIPTSYILDRQGRVILRLVGSINWDRPEIYAAFDALTAE